MQRYFTALMALVGMRSGLSAEQKHDATVAAYQSAPGIGASAVATVAGFGLSDLLVVASIAFVLMQAAYLTWKWRRDARRELERMMDRQAERMAGQKVNHCDIEVGDD